MKNVFLLMMIIFIFTTCGAKEKIDEIKGIWDGSIEYFWDFLDIKKEYKFSCIEIKPELMKAYIYIEKPINPIILNLNVIDEHEYAMEYRGNKMYFKYDKTPTLESELIFSKEINQRNYDELKTFGAGLYKGLEKNGIKYKNNVEDCLKVLAIADKEQTTQYEEIMEVERNAPKKKRIK